MHELFTNKITQGNNLPTCALIQTCHEPSYPHPPRTLLVKSTQQIIKKGKL